MKRLALAGMLVGLVLFCSPILAQNEKSVTPVGSGPEGYINPDDTLQYRVGFQNVGAVTAMNVVIRDTLDADLDTTTLQLLAGSHPYTFTRNGLELVWDFAGIQLPDSLIDEPGSHGFVQYSIVPLKSCDDYLTEISNTAHVYFESSPVVTTNTVLNTILWGDCLILLAGDVNQNGIVTTADIIRLIGYVFKGGLPPQPCVANGDVNCDGMVTSGDVIHVINYCLKSGAPPCDICCFSPLMLTCQ